MPIKIFSSDDPDSLAQTVNAWLEKCPKNTKIHFAMAAPNEEDGTLPKKGGSYIEYGICLEYEAVVGKPGNT